MINAFYIVKFILIKKEVNAGEEVNELIIIKVVVGVVGRVVSRDKKVS